jgi:hypothetical protein
MPYHYQFHAVEDYIKADVSGPWIPGQEAEDAWQVIRVLGQYCRDQGINKTLVLWNIPGRLPTLSAYEQAIQLEVQGWDKKTKTAIVHMSEERLNDALFFETVAVNRGFKIKLFSDENVALAWLQNTA